MASYTTNLNLEMPTVNEKYDVLKQNANWQKVDDYAGTVNEHIANINKVTTVSGLVSDSTTGKIEISTSAVPSNYKIISIYSNQDNRIVTRVGDRVCYLYDTSYVLVKGGSVAVKVVYSE